MCVGDERGPEQGKDPECRGVREGRELLSSKSRNIQAHLKMGKGLVKNRVTGSGWGRWKARRIFQIRGRVDGKEEESGCSCKTGMEKERGLRCDWLGGHGKGQPGQ